MAPTGERKPQNKLENFETDAILDVMESWCDQMELKFLPKRRNWGQIARRTALTACCVYIFLDALVGNPIIALEHRPLAMAAINCPVTNYQP